MLTGRFAPFLASALLLALSTSTSLADNSLGTPLRDAAILCLEGSWFLTGTPGTVDKRGQVDFDYNFGAPLWTSPDGLTWKPMGLVWDRAEHFKRVGSNKAGKWKEWNPPAERIDSLLANATTGPRFYKVGPDWFLLTAQNKLNIFLLKSKSGKPEGPYEDYANLATRGGYPSFFFDSDGAIYLILAEGWIARMKPDLSGVAEPIQPMLPKTNVVGEGQLLLGDPGVSVFKRDGRYHAVAARWFVRDGKPSHDAIVWTSDSVYGPYQESPIRLADTGPVSLFQSPKGEWFALSSAPLQGNPKPLSIPSVP